MKGLSPGSTAPFLPQSFARFASPANSLLVCFCCCCCCCCSWPRSFTLHKPNCGAMKTRLLGMTVDRNLSWVPHALETKKSFANKLNLLKRSRFLPNGVLKDFYFKVILPSVLWGSCCNPDILYSIERLH